MDLPIQNSPIEFSVEHITDDFGGNNAQLSTIQSNIQAIMEDQQLLETPLLKLDLLTAEEYKIWTSLLEGYNERELTKIMGFSIQSAVNYRNKCVKFLKLELKIIIKFLFLILAKIIFF